MLYMREYWSELSDETYDGNVRKVVPGSFVLNDSHSTEYTWENLDVFIENRGTWAGYLGRLFDGAVFYLNGYYGIRSFQLLKEKDDFEDKLQIKWLNWWKSRVGSAYHARLNWEMVVYRTGDDSDREHYREIFSEWKKLVSMNEKQIQKMFDEQA